MLCTVLGSIFGTEEPDKRVDIDATVDCLLTKHLNARVEYAQHPKVGAIVTAVVAELDSAELAKARGIEPTPADSIDDLPPPKFLDRLRY